MSELPRPTENLERIEADIDAFGYGLLANALSAAQTAALRARLEEQAAAERKIGAAYRDAGLGGAGVNQRLYFLVNKGRVFRNLLKHRRARELVRHILGDEYLLSSFTANIANPGGIVQPHTDQWWMPPPTYPGKTVVRPGSMTREKARGAHMGGEATAGLPMIPPAVACNVMWMLTDFTEENGATCVAPGSHLLGRQPDPELDSEIGWVPAAAPAGTAMIFEGRLWHSTGANRGTTPRLGVLNYFCAPQFRQQENLTLGVSQEVLDEADADLLALLGFKTWSGYGRVESPRQSFVVRGETGLGELRP